MKGIALDAGPVISLSTSGLSWILRELKEKTGIPFFITPNVKKELFDRPIFIKRFEIKAIQTLDMISKGYIKIIYVNPKIVNEFDQLVNNCFFAHGKPIKILHSGEIEAVCAVLEHNLNALVIDERTTRLLIEDNKYLHHILSSRLHTYIEVNKSNIERISKITRGLKIIRSTELI